MTTITNAKDFNSYISTVMSSDLLVFNLERRTILVLQVDKLCHSRTYAEDISLNGMIITLSVDGGHFGTLMCTSIEVHQESEDLNVE